MGIENDGAAVRRPAWRSGAAYGSVLVSVAAVAIGDPYLHGSGEIRHVGDFPAVGRELRSGALISLAGGCDEDVVRAGLRHQIHLPDVEPAHESLIGDAVAFASHRGVPSAICNLNRHVALVGGDPPQR